MIFPPFADFSSGVFSFARGVEDAKEALGRQPGVPGQSRDHPRVVSERERAAKWKERAKVAEHEKVKSLFSCQPRRKKEGDTL